jgi:hypothetical protein
MKKIIVFLFSVLLFTSCEKYIDISIPDEGRKITVNCLINDQDIPILTLNYSKFILDSDDQFDNIDSAFAQLFIGDSPVATFYQDNDGLYKTDYQCQKGVNYSIKVSKGDQTVSSTTYIPNSVAIQSIDTFSITEQSNGYNTNYLRFNLSISDPIDEKNYYMVTFITIINEFSLPLDFRYTQPSISSESYVSSDYAVFSDDFFNGQNKTLSYDIEYYNFTYEFTPLTVYINSISKDMYTYYLQLQKYQNAQNSFLSEPVMVYTNINNGLGIFGGYSISKKQIDIPMMYENVLVERKK